MIEWHANRHEEKWVPTWNGKWLHSQRNPEREAELWVEQFGERIVGAHTAFVLGLAGGFHIQALADRYPELKIIVIEAHEAFRINASPFVHKLLHRIEDFTNADPYILMKNRRVLPSLKKSYCILEYKHSTLLSKEYYENVKNALLSRDWKSFNFHVKLREQAWMNHYNFIEKEESLISVKHIADGLKKQNPITPEMMKWLCLRELVK